MSLIVGVPLWAADAAAPSISAEIAPAAALAAMERVADWQLANPSKHGSTEWTQAAGNTGLMALVGLSGNSKYRDAMLALAEKDQWRLGRRFYHADDHCVGQTYAELYCLYRDPKMIAPMRERFDGILAKPSEVLNLEFRQPSGRATEHWSWCDALFMGPTAWIRLYAATANPRYLDFAITNWWRTSDYLYDKEEHLYFRDSTYFERREANGKKIFWSRGNGWVMGGLVRVLQFLPIHHPDRARFEQQFKEMADQLLTCQQPDGLWRASLLDPASYPLRETSGSGFFTYAFAWGVNQGLLDRTRFEPAVRKAWTALVHCVDADGKLTHVQPIGADPRNFDENATEVYGVGAFLLAGSEVYRLAVLERSKPVIIKITNPASFRRACETVELDLKTLSIALKLDPARGKFAVMDGLGSKLLDSQVYASVPGQTPDTLLFQVDLDAGETRRFLVLDATSFPAVPQPIVKTFARFVPERMDDFVWESDRIAHRMYGQALIKGEGTISSGVDVWIKRTRNLVADNWYKSGQYHEDHGEGLDDYKVGPSRGCGGLGIWDGKQLQVSSNFRNSRVITTGPIRSEFELTYDAWDAAGRKVAETKRIRIDAGSNFSRAQSTFSSPDSSPLTLGVGIVERPGDGTIVKDPNAGWLSYWEPAQGTNGNTACALILPAGSVREFASDKTNLLAISQAQVDKPFVYYFGAGWSKSGDFPDAAAWEFCVRRFAQKRDAPLKIETAIPYMVVIPKLRPLP
jgi:rhamnogalacturonyl hydrolase YesR